MFDIDSGKLLIVAVLALIVIGPKELPRVLRQIGQSVGKMRRMASEFQGQFMDAMKEADIADIRKELNELNSSAALDYHFDPVKDVRAELTSAMAPVTASAPDSAVASPGENFNLPSIEPAEAQASAFAEGIAPVVDDESPRPDSETLPAAAAVPTGHAEAELLEKATPLSGAAVPKRKIRIKRRLSSFNVVRGEQAAWTSGEPLAVRQRAVKAKLLVSQDGVNA